MKKNKRLFYLLFIAILFVSVALLSSCGNKNSCSHTYGEWKTVLRPTCVSNGRAESVCTKCNEIGSKTLQAIGHEFLDYKFNNNETCTSTGTRTATCDRLDCYEKNTIAMTGTPKGHIYNNGKCTACAIEAYAISSEEFDFDASATEADNVKVKVYRASDGHIEIDIFGSGNMKNFASGSEAPWAPDYADNIVTVHIYDGVGSVGNNAFAAFTNITKVVLGKDVKNIGKNAFSEKLAPNAVYIDDIATWVSLNFADTTEVPPIYMTERIYVKEERKLSNGETYHTYSIIKNITIPDTIEKINAYAFFACDELDTIRIYPSVKEIGNYAFYGCSITDIYIYDLAAWCNIDFAENGANPLAYGKHLFLSGKTDAGVTVDTEIKDLVIPDGITVIKPYAFEGASSIVAVSFNGNVTEIGKFAFANCTALTELNLPESLIKIDEWAFAGCKRLPTLVIPDRVSYIGNNAFKSTSNLASVVIGDGLEVINECLFSSATNLTKVVLGSNVKEIKELAFYGCNRLVEIHNKSSLSIAQNDAHGYIGKNAKHIYSDTEESFITVTDDGFIFYFDGEIATLIATMSLDAKLNLPADFNGQDYVIADGAFSGRTHFTDVIFNGGIAKIGKDAFLNCGAIKNISISSLEDWLKIELESEHSNPMGYAENLYIADSVIGIEAIAIPESISVIGPYAFAGATMLTSIKLHDSITEIKKNAFYRCNAMKLEKGIYTVDGWIVDVSTTVTSITIKSDVKGISDDAFNGVKLETASLPARYLKFIDTTKLKTLTVSEGIIPSGALVNANNLSIVNISTNVTAIETGAFDLSCKALKTTNGIIYADNWIVGFKSDHKEKYEAAYSTVGIADGAFDNFDSNTLYFSGNAKKWGEIKVSEFYKETVDSITVTLDYKK